jgi:two-component system chemotaxis response regulator CheB
VLVVDDSVAARMLLSDALAGSGEVQVVGSAPNGAVALTQIPQLNPDVITLDVEMPGMNGIATLAEIRRQYPRLPVIMFSSFTETGAAITVQALSAGASDYVTKPNNVESYAAAVGQVRQDLLAKIVALVNGGAEAAEGKAGVHVRLPKRKWPGVQLVEVLAIGASTGGPTALSEVLGHLPADFPVPIVVVQHMPPLFTRFLAERLNANSGLSVREAQRGERLETGDVWIAPGDYHMTVGKKGTERFVDLDQGPPENSCRPAVDVLFRSVASAYGSGTLAVVLTGMGTDGARGAACIRDAGGEVLVQDKHSSVVWGMPGAVVKAGAADGVFPLRGIAAELVRRVKAGRARVVAAH